ncbi:stage II sporulation protein D [Gorillibacterium sp. CAU 1737]|uniref:stage II sporulation protein D n=1 Tax=Gorillibacterium sp. CAU 1737 TaxID=3140362 RepID=UPI0032611367
MKKESRAASRWRKLAAVGTLALKAMKEGRRAGIPLRKQLSRVIRRPRLVIFTSTTAVGGANASPPGTTLWRVRRTPSLPILCLGAALLAALGVVTAGALLHERGKSPATTELRPAAASPQPGSGKAGQGAPAAAPADPGAPAAPLAEKLSLVVPVYLSQAKTVERLPIEDYVLGVVAAEMPADFAPEALKAQALAARTYIVRRYLDEDFSGVPVKTAWVTDTVQHQAYLTRAKLKKAWGAAYEEKLARLRQAVEETAGKIITYKGKPINAVFFSVGNGYTENAEEYWSVSEPYLKSVSSPWDKEAPGYEATVRFTGRQLLQKLGLSGKISIRQAFAQMKVTERTEGKRVGTLKIGRTTFSGREVREKLGLRSSAFTWKVSGDEILVTTYGNGHGVGMSQWGANGMAAAGKTAEEIITYYYRGVQLEEAGAVLPASALGR